MDRLTLERLLIQIRWQITRLSLIGKIGLGLLVLSTVFFWAAVLPQEEELHKRKGQAASMQQQTQIESVERAKLDDSQALQVFYDFFPNLDSSPYWIKELDKVAKKRGIELSGSEYRLMQEQGAKLARYEMVLPVRGSYPQIRAFIADVLAAVPAMALTDVVIKREDIKTGKLDVRLSLNLYLHG
ncbi:type 4a pilus biogenesis protein PilO [Nitrosomonas communis]|uniref:type 4a pilus biogenesis protein PilO n=1 Tax=Nitrosomonas communis TaxID=44574 RepID=UPI0026F0480A|nr:type 4a pilus biogenesis protein PilO [Nitrosomonas communis]MCO6427334.1 type 4a pilus biogenesis protein PilO [Nitrosomonas communis]